MEKPKERMPRDLNQHPLLETFNYKCWLEVASDYKPGRCFLPAAVIILRYRFID